MGIGIEDMGVVDGEDTGAFAFGVKGGWVCEEWE